MNLIIYIVFLAKDNSFIFSLRNQNNHGKCEFSCCLFSLSGRSYALLIIRLLIFLMD